MGGKYVKHIGKPCDKYVVWCPFPAAAFTTVNAYAFVRKFYPRFVIRLQFFPPQVLLAYLTRYFGIGRFAVSLFAHGAL